MNATRNTTAQAILSAGFEVAKRFVRYCGSVIESPAACEKRRRRAATNAQLAIVPSARPMPIQTLPMPKARMEPGKPMRSQPDMSEACADIAETHGPIWRPPRKYSFSPPPLVLTKK